MQCKLRPELPLAPCRGYPLKQGDSIGRCVGEQDGGDLFARAVRDFATYAWHCTRRRHVVSARLMGSSPLHNCLFQNAAVDFLLPVQLCRRELSLEFCLLEKPVFLLVVEISHSIGMLDQIIVGIGGEVSLYALQTFKEVSGVDADKAIDADVPNVSCRSVESISDVAMLKNVLTARALIEFLADLNPNQLPFEASRFEHL